jgi:hypothetical protein
MRIYSLKRKLCLMHKYHNWFFHMNSTISKNTSQNIHQSHERPNYDLNRHSTITVELHLRPKYGSPQAEFFNLNMVLFRFRLMHKVLNRIKWNGMDQAQIWWGRWIQITYRVPKTFDKESWNLTCFCSDKLTLQWSGNLEYKQKTTKWTERQKGVQPWA